MKTDQTQHFYNEQQHIVQNAETLSNHIHIDMDISILSTIFVDFQKDIFNEAFTQLTEELSNIQDKETKQIKKVFEVALQTLNSKLNLFAQKMEKVEFFEIKGSIKLIHKGILMASLIGNVSMMILRDNKLFYLTNNDYKKLGKIDFFSEFVEGDVHDQDEILLVGNDIYQIFDKKEIKKFNEVFTTQNSDIREFLEETMTMRIPKETIGFIIIATYHIAPQEDQTKENKGRWRMSSINAKQKFAISITVISLILLVLIINILSGSKGGNELPSYTNEVGEKSFITPEQIKKDIAYFQKLPPSSDEKSHLYRQITEQLDYLAAQAYWPEDIDMWRRILEKHYNKGFNIIYETSLNNFDDELNASKAQIIAFNEGELSTIQTPISIVSNNQLIVAGSNGALIGIVNEDIRGSLVNYTEEDQLLECTSNLLRDGLYCFTSNSNIYNLTKAGSSAVTTETPGGFPNALEGIGIFDRTNLYLLSTDPLLNSMGTYIYRYRNIVGSQSQFQGATEYKIILGSGASTPKVNDIEIDGSFLLRNPENSTINQRWREGSTFTLNTRQVTIAGGDSNQASFGPNTKIITHINTRYVFLFDPSNQTFTVYDSNGIKTNDAYTNSFTLSYLLKFKFALTNENIIDITINEKDGNQVVAYILTDKGVYKIKVFEFIEEVKNNETN